MKTITEKTTKILNLIIPEGDIDYKVRKILREDLKGNLQNSRSLIIAFKKNMG